MDYETLNPPVGHQLTGPMTRKIQEDINGPCYCSVCHVGKLSGGLYNQHVSSTSEPVGRPRSVPVPEPVVVCSICLSSYGPGQRHDCTSQTKRKNLEGLVRTFSDNSKERFVSSQLKEIFSNKGDSTNGGIVKLATGGRPISASLGHLKAKPLPKFTNESLNRLQLQLGVSDNKMKDVDNFLRVHCGRDSVNKHEEYMKERNSLLKDKFCVKFVSQTEKVPVDNGDQENKKETELHDVLKPVVFANNVEDLVSFVLKERCMSADTSLVQVGIDDGQGQLKIMMSIKDKDETETCKGKIAKYEDGFSVNEFKYSGVKKLILLLVSPTCENYSNLVSLLQDLKIDALEFGYC